MAQNRKVIRAYFGKWAPISGYFPQEPKTGVFRAFQRRVKRRIGESERNSGPEYFRYDREDRSRAITRVHPVFPRSSRKKKTRIRVTAAFPDTPWVIGGAGFFPDCRTVNGPKPTGRLGVFLQTGPGFRVFSTGTKTEQLTRVSKRGSRSKIRKWSQVQARICGAQIGSDGLVTPHPSPFVRDKGGGGWHNKTSGRGEGGLQHSGGEGGTPTPAT